MRKQSARASREEVAVSKKVKRWYKVGIRGFSGSNWNGFMGADNDHWDGTKIIEAETAGKAKYQFIRDISDAFDVSFQHLTCQSLREYKRSLTRAEVAQQEADAFNLANPVGTMVRYWTWTKEGEPTGTGPVRWPAQVLCGHASVWIKGCVGAVNLSHVEVCSTQGANVAGSTEVVA